MGDDARCGGGDRRRCVGGRTGRRRRRGRARHRKASGTWARHHGARPHHDAQRPRQPRRHRRPAVPVDEYDRSPRPALEQEFDALRAGGGDRAAVAEAGPAGAGQHQLAPARQVQSDGVRRHPHQDDRSGHSPGTEAEPQPHSPAADRDRAPGGARDDPARAGGDEDGAAGTRRSPGRHCQHGDGRCAAPAGGRRGRRRSRRGDRRRAEREQDGTHSVPGRETAMHGVPPDRLRPCACAHPPPGGVRRKPRAGLNPSSG